jgi:menaquinone-dependent protoporphyrinogen oxidase
MNSVLVVYGSWAGSTASVAHRIGKALTAQGVTARVMSASSDPDPTPYDGVVVGSGVHGGVWHPKVRQWVADRARALKGKPTAFFSVCLTPVSHPLKVAEARGYTLPLSSETGVRPFDVGVFAGAFDPKNHSLGTRMLAKAWGAKAGDFRDWAAVDEWTSGIMLQLLPHLARERTPQFMPQTAQ